MKNLLHSSFAQWALKKALGSPKTTALITTLITQAIGLLVAKLHLSEFMPADALATIVKTLTENSIESGIALQAVFYGKVMQWQKQGVTAMQEAINLGDNSTTVKADGVAGNESVKAAAKAAEVPVQDVVEAVKPPKAIAVDS